MKAYVSPILSAALKKLKEIVVSHAEKDGADGKRLVVFCEDRLSLVAERAVCEAVGGTFCITVYSLSRFMSAEAGVAPDVLTSQGSAMVMRRLIEAHKDELYLFKRLSTAAAAQDVYDTVALLYSSRVSADDLKEIEVESRLLERKLHDLALLYEAYDAYTQETGAIDRNVYLRRLPDIIRYSARIKGADVVFFGFQAFTASVEECVRACMETADDVCGIFIGGRESKYVNEGWTAFLKLAEEHARGSETENVRGVESGVKAVATPSGLCPVAEHLRRYMLEPENYYKSLSLPISGGQLGIFAAESVEEECEFIAAHILKCVKEDGIRYREISVMVPDLAAYRHALERSLSEYGIPFYFDCRYPLINHSISNFILDYLSCAVNGCRPENVAAVVASPIFKNICVEEEPAKAEPKNRAANQDNYAARDIDVFINYSLRAASYRGAVKKPAKENICKDAGLDFLAVERVRKSFVTGLAELPFGKATGEKICAAIIALLDKFGAEKRLMEISVEAERCGFFAEAVMSSRAYTETVKVVKEAAKLVGGEKIAVTEFAKILKSGLTAAEISLIQPKQDATFISDVSSCANAGSKVLFAAGLTEGVPSATQDTAILTDGDLSAIERAARADGKGRNVKAAVSPKIAQVNDRVREITALNVCSFSERLFLSYPVRLGGEERAASEIIAYTKKLFSVGGNPIARISCRDDMKNPETAPYYCARIAPAVRKLALYIGDNKINDENMEAREKSVAFMSAVYVNLASQADDNGELFAALETLKSQNGVADGFDCGDLYGYRLSPTALETYYSCPYLAFMRQGLRLEERRESAFRPLDSGNFIHAVLEKVAKTITPETSEEDCRKTAIAEATELLKHGDFAADSDDGKSAYAAKKLVEEAETLAAAMYVQLANSDFSIDSYEKDCVVKLDGKLSVGGRIDRVDTCGDMVRVIDYKTGAIDDEPSSYYMGLKLQLPLYLGAASEGMRAVGAYYFPASLDYSADGVGLFTLRGFMDGSADVVKSSDTTVEERGKSRLVGAYLNGRPLDKAMPREDFVYFLAYSREMARRGAESLVKGKIAPSPVNGACDYCPYNGNCGYDAESRGERKMRSANCRKIAEIVRTDANGGEVKK